MCLISFCFLVTQVEFFSLLGLVRDSLPTVSKEHHGCLPRQQLAKKRRTLRPDELQRTAAEVRSTLRLWFPTICLWLLLFLPIYTWTSSLPEVDEWWPEQSKLFSPLIRTHNSMNKSNITWQRFLLTLAIWTTWLHVALINLLDKLPHVDNRAFMKYRIQLHNSC